MWIKKINEYQEVDSCTQHTLTLEVERKSSSIGRFKGCLEKLHNEFNHRL